jgi:DNA-binding CsgD family transcriptional regulator
MTTGPESGSGGYSLPEQLAEARHNALAGLVALEITAAEELGNRFRGVKHQEDETPIQFLDRISGLLEAISNSPVLSGVEVVTLLGQRPLDGWQKSSLNLDDKPYLVLHRDYHDQDLRQVLESDVTRATTDRRKVGWKKNSNHLFVVVKRIKAADLQLVIDMQKKSLHHGAPISGTAVLQAKSLDPIERLVISQLLKSNGKIATHNSMEAETVKQIISGVQDKLRLKRMNDVAAFAMRSDTLKWEDIPITAQEQSLNPKHRARIIAYYQENPPKKRQKFILAVRKGYIMV